jgi:gluconate:H+ symporter, GntP family
LGIATVLVAILLLKLHPFLGLILGTLVLLVAFPTEATIARRLAHGIADVFEKIGLPIVFASVVGGCLLDSGAATRIVQAIVTLFGPKRIAPALTVSGFLMAIPVYFDTVFYLLLPLAKAVARDRPQNYLLSVMAIIVGATMAHSLVPPTPGPLLVASELGVPIGMMMLGGTIVGGIASAFGFAYGFWCSQWMSLQLPEMSNDSETANRKSMPLVFALLPLLVPLSFIGVAEAYSALVSSKPPMLIALFGDPTFALLVAALLGLLLIRAKLDGVQTQRVVTKSIADAGVILLLTCAGGGFGYALKEIGVGPAVVQLFPKLTSPLGLLFMAFVVTAIIRVAQGSATVAMTTTAGIMQPLVSGMQLPYHPIYVALAIGCGSKLLPWMNDSGFWQVASMTGMSTQQTLKTFSAALTLMGCIGFCVVLLGSLILPLV